MTELDVGSPFDYEDQAVLYCAAHLPDPRASGYLAALADELAGLIEAAGGRTLALFTSFRVLDETAAALADRVDVPILTPAVRCPRAASSRQFAADPATCLFATMGFWQGVDVPGDACSPGGDRPHPVPPARRAAAPGPAGAGRRRRVRPHRPAPGRHAPRPGRRPAHPLAPPTAAWSPCSTPAWPTATLPLGRRAGPPAHAPHQGPARSPSSALRAIRDATSRQGVGVDPPRWPPPPPFRRSPAQPSASGPSSSSPGGGPRCCWPASRVVFVVTVVAGADGGSVLGYVQAMAEASMVGGLADWFAVVAIFRHPLGPAHPPHGDHPRAQGAVRRDARRLHPVELPHPRRGRRAGAGAPTSAAGSPAGWPTRPTPSAWPATSPTPPCRWPTCSGTRTCRPPSTAPSAAASSRRRSRRWPAGRSTCSPGTAATTSWSTPRSAGLAALPRRAPRGAAPPLRAVRRRGGCPGAVEDRIFQRLLDGARTVLDEMVRRPRPRPAPPPRRAARRPRPRPPDLTRAPGPGRPARPRPPRPARAARLGRPASGPRPRPPCGPRPPTRSRELRQGLARAIAGRRPAPARRAGARRHGPERRRAGGPLRRRALRRRDHPPRQHHDLPVGRRGDRRSASSCSSAPTSSSSASTAPWSAASPASSSTPSPRSSASLPTRPEVGRREGPVGRPRPEPEVAQ